MTSFRYSKDFKRIKPLKRVLWDLPDLCGPLPQDIQNGYDAYPQIKGTRRDEMSPSPPPDVVDNLTSGISALTLTTTTTKKTSTNLKDIIGKGFCIESFTTLLQDQEIYKLESHFKWILQLVEHDGPLDVKRITILKQRMLAWVAESDQHLSVFQTVAQKLLLATYSGFLSGENDDSIKYFKEAQGTITKATQDPEETSIEQLRVYRYIKLCDQILISQCSILLSKDTKGTTLSLEDFRATIADCDTYNQKVFCDDAAEATLCGMKGHLANQLGLTSKSIEFFRRAVDLNPNCYDWQHHLYTALRRGRRESEYGSPPSIDEYNVCLKANELRPKYWVSLLAIANLFQDINKARKKRVSHEEWNSNSTRIIQALTKACELAPDNVSVNLKLAEAYSDLKTLSPEERTACETLFEYCEKKWPNNSQVFHKIGKFYLKSQPELAEEYFAKALHTDPMNFPCLHDYLRRKFTSLNGRDAVSLIDQYIPVYKYKRTFLGKLYAMKGYIEWQINAKMDAVRSWVIGFDVFEDVTDNKMLANFYQSTMSGFNDSFFGSRYGQDVINFNQVRKTLDELDSEELLDILPDVQIRIDGFLAFLDAHQSNNQWRSNHRYRDVSTSSGVGIEAVDVHWRSSHLQRFNNNGNNNNNYSNNRQPLNHKQEHQLNGLSNGLQQQRPGGGDNIWRRRTTTEPSMPFNDRGGGGGQQSTRSRNNNNEQEIQKSVAAEDMNWRTRGGQPNSSESAAVRRDVVFKNEYDLRITVNEENQVQTSGPRREEGNWRYGAQI